MGTDSREDRPRVEITVVEVKGSAPREPGARMHWYPEGASAETIGGGNLEQKCLEEAAKLWADPERTTAMLEFPLSEKLGQCCGGFVRMFLAERRPARRLVICGAGHVATAVASILAETPIRVTVVDARAEWADKARFDDRVEVVHDDPDAYVRELKDGADNIYLLIMTHDHPLDQSLCQLSMSYPFAWRGLIGSRTKWRRFRQRLAAKGFKDGELDRIVCPIGDPALGRGPREIAVGVGAQILGVYHGAETGAKSGGEAPAIPGLRAALILAGGASSRMGRWKGGLVYEGSALVEAHARVFESAGADVWKAIYPHTVREEAERVIPPGRRVMNETPEAPLFASLQLGLRALITEHPDLDSVLMTPVDMVPLDEDWVAAMWDRHEGSGAWATRPEVKTGDERRPVRHGHPVILDQRMIAPILAADPETARLDFLIRDLADDRKAGFEIADGSALTNLNTPEDFANALAD